MKPLGINEAKRYLFSLLRRGTAGEEVIIRRGRVPVAHLVPYVSAGRWTLGIDIGKFEVPKDFDRRAADQAVESAVLDSSSSMPYGGFLIADGTEMDNHPTDLNNRG